ncbi:MAG TPA: heavy metal translocating P-type ATPase [Gemmatimonadales bacterium]
MRLAQPAAALIILTTGAIGRLAGFPTAAGWIWAAGVVLVGFPLVIRTVPGAVGGRFAADLVASLAIVTALLLWEPLAGLVVALMQSGGEALEAQAARRATRAVRDLEAQSPRVAHRLSDRGVEDVATGQLMPGDRVLVRPGEMVPCDGIVESGDAAVDVSRVSGEALPLHARGGISLMSGSLVVDGPLIFQTLRRAQDSLYEQVVALVRTAQASKAPFQRLADRAAVWFTPLTLATCAGAWIWSGDPDRVLAVLVVATPCPLILAAPVAFVGGINRAARQGIVVRHGEAIESLAAVDAVLFDKTGTVTVGEPCVTGVWVTPPWSEPDVLAYAAAVEEGAGHPLARSITSEARQRGLPRLEASRIRESPGRGVAGVVAGREVVVGSRSLVAETAWGDITALGGSGEISADLHAYVTVDRLPAAVIGFRDQPRAGISAALGELRSLGITRLALLSGDHQTTTASVARTIGFTDVAGDLLPQDKVARVVALRRQGYRVLMVGDGINDAPALSAATVGMAVARSGSGIAAEAADVVLLSPEPRRIPEAIRMARRTLRIARQSVGLGLGLSGIAMVAAAAGFIAPVPGALLQEGIDLAVILNALRAAPWQRD